MGIRPIKMAPVKQIRLSMDSKGWVRFKQARWKKSTQKIVELKTKVRNKNQN